MGPEVDTGLEMPYPQYRCAVCDKELPLTEARLTVTCREHRPSSHLHYVVRQASAADRHNIEEICDRAWGETDIDSFGRTFDVLGSDNLVAETDDGDFVGLISLALDRGDLAVVLLSVYPGHQGSGVGSALVDAAVEQARAKGVASLKVATTNDDIPALDFYQRHSFAIYEIETGIMIDHHGGAIPGFAGIPVRDEIRLRRPVCP
ncbi:MAG: GNAT family N-acetyltransferase [Coriobacteriia bacterium]|nr:GNAT family N-acetyltransferase [Coriobacteriia bacterium]MBN2822231.1 GNAT family N-acetyltransferase [Coriobacteriia bacterium]